MLLLSTSAAAQEQHGWIVSEQAWVTRFPSSTTAVIGYIKKRAAVSVTPAEKGWLRLVPPAPVRDQKHKWIGCEDGCYIPAESFSTALPPK